MIPQIAESLIVAAGECVAWAAGDAFTRSAVGPCNALTPAHQKICLRLRLALSYWFTLANFLRYMMVGYGWLWDHTQLIRRRGVAINRNFADDGRLQ